MNFSREEHPYGTPAAARADLAGLRDEDLIVRVQEGERKAFDELAARYKNRLFSFILRMVKDPVLAEELTQETLIRVYIHAAKYREIARFSTWVFTIATNLVRNKMRQRSRRPLLLSLNPAPADDEMPLDPADPVADPSEEIQRRELASVINEATASIPEKYRIPFLLREVEQLSYEEIQQVTGLKLGTVRSRINRARNRFRQLVKPLLRDETLLEELEMIEARVAAEKDDPS
ncbi:sigma-70 family RNA polymerase sigma factor [bacterium]|nr:sigma-70 family RNA polymerase sigma factor [bacterium]PJA75606.1 MAG: RNA polymerase subunit sigma-24 [bacterium CG_4_9_14_3_um_filter_65_15]